MFQPTHTPPNVCIHPGYVQNPLAYGISWAELTSDPRLDGHRRKLIIDAARELERSKMARFDERSGNLYVTGGRRSCSRSRRYTSCVPPCCARDAAAACACTTLTDC